MKRLVGVGVIFGVGSCAFAIDVNHSASVTPTARTVNVGKRTGSILCISPDSIHGELLHKLSPFSVNVNPARKCYIALNAPIIELPILFGQRTTLTLMLPLYLLLPVQRQHCRLADAEYLLDLSHPDHPVIRAEPVVEPTLQRRVRLLQLRDPLLQRFYLRLNSDVDCMVYPAKRPKRARRAILCPSLAL